jgi:hypothetical protein
VGRYSKVSRRVWGDGKFRSLSPAPPNAQTLWLRLLTAPEQTCIPGVILIREGGLADDLGWSTEGLREAFAEVFRKGMAKADWKAGLVWLPNASKHNRPESPNVVKAWASLWPDLPDSPLKAEISRALQDLAEDLPQAFREVFRKTWPNQEQEQEQEQIPYSVPSGRAAAQAPPPQAPPASSKPSAGGADSQPPAKTTGGPPTATPSARDPKPDIERERTPLGDLLSVYREEMARVRADARVAVADADAAAARRLLAARPPEEAAEAVRRFVADDYWRGKGGWPLRSLTPAKATGYLAPAAGRVGRANVNDPWAGRPGGEVPL